MNRRADGRALAGALAIVVVALGGCSTTVAGSPVTMTEATAPAAATTPPSAPRQTELRALPLRNPYGLTVDKDGNIYATDELENSLWKLPAGSTHAIQLAARFESDGGRMHGFRSRGVAMDAAGDLYVTDYSFDDSKVVKLVEASASVIELPFTGLHGPDAVAVDSAGNVYVTDYKAEDHKGRVLKLAAGDDGPSELPFTLQGEPTGVAVDGAGNVYVTDSNHSRSRVLKLAADATTPTELLTDTGFYELNGIAVDGADNVYVSGRGTGGDQVLKFAPGTASAAPLPFTGLRNPRGVAVDRAGNVYVADHGAYEVRRGKIWRLAPA